LLAAAPVLLLIILLVGCKWSVGRAAVVSVTVDAVIALSAFGAHPLQILVSAAKGAWSSLSIILIICPAILMYNIVREAGAFRVIRAGIQQATPNKLLQILIIGYAFAAFLQGITGFGVPVAICAPLLIEIGVSPLWALAIAPLGEAWGNTFGTLSAAWDALAAQGRYWTGDEASGEKGSFLGFATTAVAKPNANMNFPQQNAFSVRCVRGGK